MIWLLSILNPLGETQGSLWNVPPQEFQWELGSPTQKGPPQMENQEQKKGTFNQEPKTDKKISYSLQSVVRDQVVQVRGQCLINSRECWVWRELVGAGRWQGYHLKPRERGFSVYCVLEVH